MNENDIKEATEAEKVTCEVCLNNIPATEAKSERQLIILFNETI